MPEKSALGWKVLSGEADFCVSLPKLSYEEEEAVLGVAERFRQVSGEEEFMSEEDVGKRLHQILLAYCADNGIYADRKQFDYLERACFAHIHGFGVLDDLLNEPEFEEIAVVGLNRPVFVYKRGEGWLKTNASFTTEECLINIINKMARSLGRRITLQAPRLNAVLKDGSRIHASIPPISNLELTIRKFRENPIHVADLVAYRTYSPEALAFLSLVLQADTSLVVSGNTSSGKTSTINALMQFISTKERILITEETPEINIPHEHCVKLLANAELGIRMSDLVADSLRMRPDRVIVGEVRTPEESQALMETITSGQARGSFATFHAQSARETLVRLRSMGILPIDLNSIDLVVVQRRMLRYDVRRKLTSEIRRCTEICEVVAGGDDGHLPKLNCLFEYDSKKDTLIPTKNRSLLVEKTCASLGIGAREFADEVARRARFVSRLEPNSTYDEVTGALQGFCFGGGKEKAPKPQAAGA